MPESRRVVSRERDPKHGGAVRTAPNAEVFQAAYLFSQGESQRRMAWCFDTDRRIVVFVTREGMKREGEAQHGSTWMTSNTSIMGPCVDLASFQYCPDVDPPQSGVVHQMLQMISQHESQQ